MKIRILVLVLLFLNMTMLADNQNDFFNDANVFLNKNVSSNSVDYASIKANRAALDDLVSQIGSFKFSSDEKTNKAFLANAYNILVIKGIVDKYPVKSPLDISGFFDKIKYNLAGKSYTLNDIENKLIRSKYNDARFHFVLVCGANGCPPIMSNAYFPSKIESQLEEQTKKALNNASFLKVKDGKIYLSQIFEWYKADFGKNVLTFINKYRSDKLDETSNYKYYSYDWSLNKK
ncbi:DUF547 domain-containing protein [Flavobacterium sp.]|uniref:DUF547 domain-containing protein n=1 Tax=Flavobacterium sp. TaxID=239 RepID=UPI00404712EA